APVHRTDGRSPANPTRTTMKAPETPNAEMGTPEAGSSDVERRVMRRLPAPWQVDAWSTQDGRVLYRVLAHDHEVVVPECSEHLAREIVASRNEGTVEADVADVQRRWQAALDAAHAETERVREHWQRECAVAIKTV